jgi:CRP/FNR family cyclic AMP-dependent transcriptional regulator
LAKTPRKFNPTAYLASAGVARTIKAFEKNDPIFAQGDPCKHVYYIQKGGVKLSVVSESGQEAVVAMLAAGDFFGEGCLAGQSIRIGSATAMTATSILTIKKETMMRLLHEEHAFSDRFNSSEKRLARALLLLARYGKQDKPQRVVPKISQETLASMVGTTRPRVNFFLNKFRKLGFIEYNGELKINSSLLTVVLHD